jgi:hypothetical protein
MAASRRKQSAAAPQSVIRDFGTQKAPRPKRGPILRPLSFGRVRCPDAGFPAPPLAKRARNRDDHSSARSRTRPPVEREAEEDWGRQKWR